MSDTESLVETLMYVRDLARKIRGPHYAAWASVVRKIDKVLSEHGQLAEERAKREGEGPAWSTGLPKDEGLYLVQTQDGDLALLEEGGIDWLIVERWIGPFEGKSPTPNATALMESVERVVPYVVATLSANNSVRVEGKPDWRGVHAGRADSSINQLKALLRS